MSDPAADKKEQPTRSSPAVASVLSSDRVVINRGSRDGIQVGERYLVYERTNEEIRDPSTQELLGRLEIPKGTGRIVSVQERIAVLESDRQLPRNAGGLAEAAWTGIGELMTPGRMAPFRSATVGDAVKRLY